VPANRFKYAARRLLLRAGDVLGVNAALNRSRWRHDRLLILCYHGFALRDEHDWDPELYVSPNHFRRRLQYLRDHRFNVLRLGDAVRRLQAGELPERSLVLTVDDGLYDFAAVAYPLLQEFACPATVYVATYYVEHPTPVFDVMASYLLWQGAKRGKSEIRLGLLGTSHQPIHNPMTRLATLAILKGRAEEKGFGGAEKETLLAELAEGLGIDYQALLASRILSLMRLPELRALDPALADIQLHSHRHRTPEDQYLFMRELEDNRASLMKAGRRREDLVHFCYPSGIHRTSFLPWLKAAGIRSATTTEPGLACRRNDPLLLPRVVDTALTGAGEFAAAASGFRSFLSRKTLGL
jgi:peptidoglycan/xylan/chitin deacetylase (PgdA/CDA1 family)